MAECLGHYFSISLNANDAYGLRLREESNSKKLRDGGKCTKFSQPDGRCIPRISTFDVIDFR